MDEIDQGLVDKVCEQYERFPFPDYSGKQLPTPSIANSDGLSRISSRLFGGRLDPSTMRVLVAGGGTGEKTLGLALQLAPFGGEVTHLDLSAASIAQARAGAEAVGLSNVRFVQGSIYDVAALFPGERFHYVQCMGVLHHLPSPEAGLAALRDILTDDGGMALAVYASSGRMAVYLLKQAVELLIDEDAPLAERMALGVQAFASLPAGHWLHHDRAVMQHLKTRGPRALLDAVLHTVDHHYSLDTFMDLIDGAGLTFVDFCEPYSKIVMDYVAPYGFAPDLAARVRALPERRRRGFLEKFHGRLVVHSAYLSKAPRAKALPTAGLDVVPTQTLFSTINIEVPPAEAGHRRIRIADRRFGGFETGIADVAVEFLREIDGERTAREILTRLAERRPPGTVSPESLAAQVVDGAGAVLDLDLISFADRSYSASRARIAEARRGG